VNAPCVENIADIEELPDTSRHVRAFWDGFQYAAAVAFLIGVIILLVFLPE
jgi:hypothetical protein